MTTDQDLRAAGRVLAGAGLVDAFGHVSVRCGGSSMAITPPIPLGTLTEDSALPRVPLTCRELPAGVPREAWIHLATYRVRPDVGGLCRAQPEYATALAVAGVPLRPVHGQGSLLGESVGVVEDSRLVRDPDRADAVAEALGAGSAVLLRGNGAVTAGATLGQAVARMWLLERSARLTAIAAGMGTPAPLPVSEQDSWRTAGAELLERIWDYLRGHHS